MPKELSDSIRARLYERSVSPLMRSVLCFWAIWNYKFILLVFSAGQLTEKYRIIDEVLYANWQQLYLHGALYPILCALIFLYCYPYPARFVFEFTRKKQIEMSNIQKRVSNESLLSVKDSHAIRRDTLKMAEAHQQELETSNIEIRALKADRDVYKADLEQAIFAAQPLTVKIKEQVRIIERLRREKNALARKESATAEKSFKANPFYKKTVEAEKQTEETDLNGIVNNTWNMEETIDTKSVEDIKAGKPLDDVTKSKSKADEDIKEAKSVESESETKPIEDEKETNSIEDAVATPPIEGKKETDSVKDAKATKPIKDEKETSSAEEEKEAKPVEQNKSKKTEKNTKDLKAIKSTKPVEDVKPADDSDDMEDFEGIEGIEGIEALGELMFKYSKD